MVNINILFAVNVHGSFLCDFITCQNKEEKKISCICCVFLAHDVYTCADMPTMSFLPHGCVYYHSNTRSQTSVCVFHVHVRASVRSSESVQEYSFSFLAGLTVLHSEVLVFSGTFNFEMQEENRYVVLRTTEP